MNNYRQQYAKYKRWFREVAKTALGKPEIRAGLEVLLAFLTVSFFAVFAIRPTVATISQLVSDTRSQKEISNQLDEKIKALREAQELWSAQQGTIKLLDGALPKDPLPDQAIQQIEGLAAKHNTALVAVNVGKAHLFGPSPKKPQADFEASFSVLGTFENTRAFLQEVEHLRRVMVVKSFSYGPAKKEAEEAEKEQILLVIGVTVPYYYREEN